MKVAQVISAWIKECCFSCKWTSAEVFCWWMGHRRRCSILRIGMVCSWHRGRCGGWSLAQWLFLMISPIWVVFCFSPVLLCIAAFFKTTNSSFSHVLAPQIFLWWPYLRAMLFASSTWWTVNCPASCTRGQETWAWVCPSTSPATPCSPTWSHTSQAWRWAALWKEWLLPA